MPISIAASTIIAIIAQIFLVVVIGLPGVLSCASASIFALIPAAVRPSIKSAINSPPAVYVLSKVTILVFFTNCNNMLE